MTTTDHIAATNWDARFRDNACIRELADSPRWSISDINKRPLSMLGLSHGKTYGASTAKPEDMWTLDQIAEHYPDTPNAAFWLKSKDCGYAMVDIEKTCPVETREILCYGLCWHYAETSLSGKGIHLIIDRPQELLDKYPDAAKAAIKAPDGTFEILLNHWCTFTMNPIASRPRLEPVPGYADRAATLLDSVFASMKPIVKRDFTTVDVDGVMDRFTPIERDYIKRDFRTYIVAFVNRMKDRDDHSKVDWCIACRAVTFVKKIIGESSTSECAAVAAALLRAVIGTHELLPYRDKYDSPRGDELYLEYTVSNAAMSLDD
jgi:hypothetical protein